MRIASNLDSSDLSPSASTASASNSLSRYHQAMEYSNYSVHRVPQSYETIQMAVDTAQPKDLILIDSGIYTESVTNHDTPNLTIRGVDRNSVILDGEFVRYNGITATADGVVVENLTTRHYRYNGIYWTGVDGYRGSYLTAYNNGEYGVYAFDSVNGRIDRSYASGHPVAGFYVGQCYPCRAVLEQLIAENNSVGYSGTNSGGDLVVRNSVFRDNMSGIVPNTLDSERLAPQRGTRIINNQVIDNNNEDAPTTTIGYSGFGSGIFVLGGNQNEIIRNRIANHLNFGIVITPIFDKQLWIPDSNRVRNNQIDRSGRVDMGLGSPVGRKNTFAQNDFNSCRPDGIEGSGPLGDTRRRMGDPWVSLVIGKGYLQSRLGEVPGGNWRKQSRPPPQQNMPNPERPPRPAVGYHQ